MAVVIPLVTEFDQKGIKLAEKRFNEFKNEAGKVGQSIKAAFLPAAAAVAGLGAAAFGAAKAAMEDQQSAALLERQLQATTKATQAQVKATEAFVSSLSLASGVADDELRPALAKILRSTKDVAKAQKLLTTAVDVAKGSGKSLAQVSEAISRAYGGNVKALARLDPSLKSFITKTTTADEALAKLAENFRGAAAKNAETFAGRMDILKVTLSEAYEQIGYALLPILQDLVTFVTANVIPKIQQFADAISKNGLKKALQDGAKEIANFIQGADGLKGSVIDLTAAVTALVLSFKGLKLIMDIRDAAQALTGIFSALSTSVIPGVTISVGLMAGVFASLLATLTEFSGLMRSTERSAFLEYIANTVKLIANGFILAYNAATRLLNLPIQGLNLLPGVNAATLPLMDLYEFSFNNEGGRGVTPKLNENAQIQINVQGAIDPVRTGQQIAEYVDRIQRRGIVPTR